MRDVRDKQVGEVDRIAELTGSALWNEVDRLVCQVDALRREVARARSTEGARRLRSRPGRRR